MNQEILIERLTELLYRLENHGASCGGYYDGEEAAYYNGMDAANESTADELRYTLFVAGVFYGPNRW